MHASRRLAARCGVPPPPPFDPRSLADASTEAIIAATRTQPTPLAFSSDAAAVAAGVKPVLRVGDRFSFACTGCGACCRSYSASVSLDSADMYRMSRGHVSMLASRPEAFRFVLGLFSTSTLPPGTSLINFNLPQHCSGVAPLLLLKSNETGVCSFAVRSSPGSSSLSCSHGPSRMPTTCTLYPVGVLLRPAAGDVLQPRAALFTVDARGCEGLEPNAAASQLKSVGEYGATRGVTARVAESDWCAALVASVAVCRLDVLLAAAQQALNDALSNHATTSRATASTPRQSPVDAYMAALRRAWFKFPVQREWGQVQDALVRDTRRIVEVVAHACEQVTAHAAEMKQAAAGGGRKRSQRATDQVHMDAVRAAADTVWERCLHAKLREAGLSD